MTSAPQPEVNESDDLALRYAKVRERSLALIEPLSAEDCQVQSMPDVSPAKWHLAHTTWFFETFLLQDHTTDYRPFNTNYGYLFNSYYNGVGQMHPRPERGMLTRPSLDEVLTYREHVDAAIRAFIKDSLPAEASELIELGLNHEQQHQELMLTDIQHVLSRNPLRPAYDASPAPELTSPDSTWLGIEQGLVEIGHSGEGFTFDNEGPRHRYWQADAEICNRLVTNGEYQQFMDDGGYTNPLLWTSDGWAVVNEHNWQAPLYWHPERSTRYSLHGEVEIDPNAPVTHISWYEADAYARWAGARLPTEQEWELAEPNLEQAYGLVWQWTASPYAPYPGFRPAAGVVGEYNGKFMCNQFVLRGSSLATATGHSRRSYRNFFYPDARWQFSGLRLTRDTGQ